MCQRSPEVLTSRAARGRGPTIALRVKGMPRRSATAEAQPRHGRRAIQDTDRHIAARMRERRIMLGMTQQELAEAVGITYQQAHKYETGANRISAGRLHA